MNAPDRTCTRCGICKPITEFAQHGKYPDNRRHVCKACKLARRRERYALDPDYREKLLSEKRARYPEVAERVCARQQRYREQHPDKVKETSQRYWRSQKGHDMGRKNNNRRRALKFHNGGTFTASDVRAQYKAQKGRCYWCSEKVGKRYHVDHFIPLSRGGANTPDNLVISCPSCNLRRRHRFAYVEWAPPNPLFPQSRLF